MRLYHYAIRCSLKTIILGVENVRTSWILVGSNSDTMVIKKTVYQTLYKERFFLISLYKTNRQHFIQSLIFIPVFIRFLGIYFDGINRLKSVKDNYKWISYSLRKHLVLFLLSFLLPVFNYLWMRKREENNCKVELHIKWNWIER